MMRKLVHFLSVVWFACGLADERMENLSGRSGTITSPGYPSYPNNVNYTWIIRTEQPEMTVSFTFDDLNIIINRDDECKNDFVAITEIDPCCSEFLRKCGQLDPFTVNVTGNVTRISFVTDGRDTAKGFKLRWKVTGGKDQPENHSTSAFSSITKMDILPLSNSATAFLSPTTRTRETVTTDAPNVPITATLYSADRSLKTSEFELTSMIGTLTESEVTEEPDDASIDILPLSNSATTFLSPTTRTRETVTTDAPNVPITETLYSADRSLNTAELELTSMIGTLTELEVAEEADDTSIVTFVVGGACAVVITYAFIAVGVYIVKQWRRRPTNSGKYILDSSKTVCNLDNFYDTIPEEHFSLFDDNVESTIYAEVPENTYDRMFTRRPRVNDGIINIYGSSSPINTTFQKNKFTSIKVH
ncbi:uncharacterized protein LOC125682613 isoform X2 [Ostrea edulis]|uniref:uncharacterized protein LOC125682613 isoform X2 n=1 Tax=Ostrea edulis TaxID=37623 RepID=UPI0024AF8361|nr:uncharacterized protein LOC125682613 isoform X2 [Ostrea edulis]